MDARATAEELRELGLTKYEARCYVSLARLGPSDPRRVAQDAEIPPPNAYESLKRLEALGWVDLVAKRPATYRAKRPEAVKSMVVSKMTDVFDALEKVYNANPVQEAELVYTIRGREKVLGKLHELINAGRKSIVLVAPTMGLDDPKLIELVGSATKRRVRVRVIGDEGAEAVIPPGVELRMGRLVAVDLLVDDSFALIALPDYSACGWIDSPQVAQHFKQFLELMWNNSKAVGRR